MEICVRAFIFDDDDNLLLVKHDRDQLRVLPGGHAEDDETIYEALEREIDEELGMPIVILWSENSFSDRNVVALPLPVSIHKVKYEHASRWKIEKLEFHFFARAQGPVAEEQKDEIYNYQRITQEDFLTMEWNVETRKQMQEVLEQNQELLELL